MPVVCIAKSFASSIKSILRLNGSIIQYTHVFHVYIGLFYKLEPNSCHILQLFCMAPTVYSTVEGFAEVVCFITHIKVQRLHFYIIKGLGRNRTNLFEFSVHWFSFNLALDSTGLEILGGG